MHQFLSLILLVSALLIGVHADCDHLVNVGGDCPNICCFDNICCGPGTVWFEGQCVPVHTISPVPNEIPSDWSGKCFQSECEAEECCAEGTELVEDPNRSDDACWCVFNPGPTPTPSPGIPCDQCTCENTGKFIVNGESTGTADKQRVPDGERPSDDELKCQDEYVKGFDGKISFEGEYYIALGKYGDLEIDKSWVQFDLICFTQGGEVKNKPFKTEKIPIIDVDMEDECQVLDFAMVTHRRGSWYPKADAETFNLDKQIFSGIVNLQRPRPRNERAHWRSSYGTEAEGIRSSFVIDGALSDTSDMCK